MKEDIKVQVIPMCIDCLNKFKQTNSLEISIRTSKTCCTSLKGKIQYQICYLMQGDGDKGFNLSCTNNFQQSSFVFKFLEVRKCKILVIVTLKSLGSFCNENNI